MSPHEIEILLHYYYSPNDFNDGNFSQATKSALDNFSEKGIFDKVRIENNENSFDYRPNKAAIDLYVHALMEVPLPEKQWVIPTPLTS